MRFKSKFARFENWDDGTGSFGDQAEGTVESRLNSGGVNTSAIPPMSQPLEGGTADILSGPSDVPPPF